MTYQGLTFSILALTAVGWMAACADTAHQPDHQPNRQVSAVVQSTTLGFTSTAPTQPGYVIHISEIDGSNVDLAWAAETSFQEGSLKGLQSCLADARWQFRFADPAASPTPHAVRSAVDHCMATSNMPPYEEHAAKDSTEYTIQLSTGDIHDRTRPEVGSRVWASGGAPLGALRHVSNPTTNRNTVETDVNTCTIAAADKGIFDTARTSTSDGLFVTSQGYTTIQPMLERFDQCLREKGYTVSDIKRP